MFEEDDEEIGYLGISMYIVAIVLPSKDVHFD